MSRPMLRKIERAFGYYADGVFFRTQEEAYKAIAIGELGKVVDTLDLSPFDHLDKMKLTSVLWAKRAALIEALQTPIAVEDSTRGKNEEATIPH
jgi:hypothetical protein